MGLPHRLEATSGKGPIQRALDPAGQLPVAEDTFDGFLTANNISDVLIKFDDLNTMRTHFLNMRAATLLNPPHAAPTIRGLNARYANLVREGRDANANFKADAWGVGGVVENNRFEVTLTWRGRTALGNKTLHCSFRHLLLSYLEARYRGNPLNTVAYCSYGDLRRGMVAFARHLKQALGASADARTLGFGAANAYDAGGELKFEADNGFNPGAVDIHCYPIATAGKAATIGQDVFNDFATVLGAYRTYASTGDQRPLATDNVQAAWFLIKDNAEAKEIFEGGGFWHELDRLIATEDENLMGVRFL